MWVATYLVHTVCTAVIVCLKLCSWSSYGLLLASIIFFWKMHLWMHTHAHLNNIFIHLNPSKHTQLQYRWHTMHASMLLSSADLMCPASIPITQYARHEIMVRMLMYIYWVIHKPHPCQKYQIMSFDSINVDHGRPHTSHVLSVLFGRRFWHTWHVPAARAALK